MNKHWKTYKLQDNLNLINGYAFKGSDFIESGVPVLKIKNVKSNQFLLDDLSWVKKEVAEKAAKAKIKSGDIVITMTGNRKQGGPDSWVGKAAYYQGDEMFYANQRLGILRNKETSYLDIRFVHYFLSQWDSQVRFVEMASGAGGQVNLSPSQILGIEISAPPLPEQRAIASILSALDDKIELNLQMNKTLEEMAMALYKHWFVDFGPFKDGKCVESELGMIPEGWEVKSIFELCEVLNNKRIPLSSMQRENRKGVFPYYGASGIIDYIDDFIFDGEYVIISEDGENLKSRKTPVAFLGYGKFWVNNHAHILRGKLNGINEVLIQHFSQLDLNPYLTGAVQPKLNKQNLESVKIPIPKDLELFQKVLNEFYLYSQLSVSNLIENQILSKQRDSLLPKLISGEFKLKANG
jgi:type I restriction enzyme, S subunit